MNTLLITYDINREHGNSATYRDLEDSIKALGTWWHHLESTWLVRTTLSAPEMRDRLTKYLDQNDELLVINVTGDHAAWTGLSVRGADWLRNNL